MKKVLVVSPMPMMNIRWMYTTRHKSEGCNIHWIIVSGISETEGYSAEMVVSRSMKYRSCKMYGFDSVYNLGFPRKTNTIPMQVLVESLRYLIKISQTYYTCSIVVMFIQTSSSI